MTRPLLVLQGVGYTYPGTGEPVVDSVSLSIAAGEFVLLTGPSGCGKSTLASLVKGLIREGVTGTITIDGEPAAALTPAALAQRVGMVFQNPDLQFFGVTVQEDVAFGPENLGLPRDEIRSRMEEALAAVGCAHLAGRVIATLSGGERQRVAIAGALAMRPRLLILDEPTSDLDPGGRRETLEALSTLRAGGVAVLLIEHNLEEVAEYADRCLVMDGGRIIVDDTPFEALSDRAGRLTALGVHPPQRYRLARELGLADASDRSLLDALARRRPMARESGRGGSTGRPAGIAFDRVTTDREGRRRVLDSVSCTIGAGEFVAIIGPNGAGKSTFAGHLIGFLRPTGGTVRVGGEDASEMTITALARRVGYLFQNPDNQLFMDTVAREIGFGLRNYGVDDIDGRVARAMAHAGLTAFAARPPQAISRGQRQRVAVASILAMEPRFLVLDEPTTGQDRGHLYALLDEMVELHRAGRTVLLITHDLTLVASYAERVLVMDGGRLVYDGTPADLFYTSTVLESLGWEPPVAIRLGRTLGWSGLMTPEGLAASAAGAEGEPQGTEAGAQRDVDRQGIPVPFESGYLPGVSVRSEIE